MKTYQRGPEEPDHQQVFVDMSACEVVADGTTLVAYGLGACVGVAVYDPTTGVGGLARAMLPRQSDGAGTSPTKYVDAAVETLVREAIEAGAGYGALEGYIVGGSDLLALQHLPRDVSTKNVTVARETFAELDIPVKGTAVGGSQGRTVEFDTADGEIRVSTVHDTAPTILRSGVDGTQSSPAP